MPKFYKIRGLPGFDGFVAKGDPLVTTTNDGDRIDVVSVKELLNLNVIIGDRSISFPMPPDCLLIGADAVVEIDDPGIREYTAQTPFGPFEYEGHYKKDGIQVDYAVYGNGMSVSVKDTSVNPVKTVYSQNYYGDYTVDAEEAVEKALREDSYIEDLVFALKDITNAQAAAGR